MIYKKTYRLTTVLLLGALGLSAHLDYLKSNQSAIQQVELIKQLESNNRQIAYYNEMKVEDFREFIRRKKTYHGLVDAADQVLEQRSSLNDVLIKKEKELKEIRNLNLMEQYRAEHRICAETNQELSQFKKDILAIVIELSKDRRFGIKPDEINALKEKIESYYTQPLERSFFSRTNDLQLQLARLKNQYFQINTIVINYLTSKVAGQRVRFDRFQVLSFANETKLKQGEVFETSLGLVKPISDSSIHSVKVNGKPIQRNENPWYSYSHKTNRKGKHSYVVEMELKNKDTGKIESFKRTYWYQVR